MTVITDFAIASTPKSEVAQRLAAEAREQLAKVSLPENKKKGTLRTLTASGSGELFQLNPYLISIHEGWNCRDLSSQDNIDHIDDLARNIAQIGVKQPLTVVLNGKEPFLTDGHCRLLATFRAIEVYGAEISAVPVIVESGLVDEPDRKLSQIVKNSGKRPSVIEMGRLFADMYENFKWTPEKIADRLGNMTAARVSQMIEFMKNSNNTINSMITKGEISHTLASDILRESGNNPEDAAQVLTEAVENAKAEGKTKATKKHVADKITPKVAMKAIFESKKTIIEREDETVTITMPKEFWEQISKLYKIV